MEALCNSSERSKTTHLQTKNPTTSIQSSNTKTVFVNPTLPLDIISEILSTLPVKSLSRFRCVSKEWCSLISSSDFVKLHLKVLASRKDYAHHKIITCCFGRFGNLKQCSLQSLISQRVTDAVAVDYPMKNIPHDIVLVVGSCHGLICIAISIVSFGEKDLIIWNPTIGKFKKVPGSGAQFKCRFDSGAQFKCRFDSGYAFGYDELNDDYKVVGIFFCCNSRALCKCDSGVKVMVYSLSSDSWRRIGAIENPYYAGEYVDGKYVNGKIHWAVQICSVWEIVSLDLARETYGKVELPNYGGIESELTLGVVCDYLCVLSEYEGCMDLWVMREYGVNESWTKIVINPPELKDILFSFPLCITENGEVVLGFDTANKTEIVLYDQKKKLLQYHELTNFYAINGMTIYVESLVSPVTNSEAGRNNK